MIKKIAVIGTGIAGLSAAWLLRDTHSLTIFEKQSRCGGHSNTVDVELDNKTFPIDTGFIVYNELNYWNLVKLFEVLGVKSSSSNMSFSVSSQAGKFEYNQSLNSLLSQRRNIVSPYFWKMFWDITKFYRDAPNILENEKYKLLTLGEYLDRSQYSKGFIIDHILPMGSAIWSTPMEEIKNYPLVSFIKFYQSHGLLQFRNRPSWRTVSAGSRSYVTAIAREIQRSGSNKLFLKKAIKRIHNKSNGVIVTDDQEKSWIFDAVIVGTHADEALNLLADPTIEQQNILGSFTYTKNNVFLHSDITFMPKNRKLWSSWNYIRPNDSLDSPAHLTYWMNNLQRLPTTRQYFITLNALIPPNEETIVCSIVYKHPKYDFSAIKAQEHLSSLQGEQNIWFCGSYFGSGFHEDALKSGLAAAEAIGRRKRPWPRQKTRKMCNLIQNRVQK